MNKSFTVIGDLLEFKGELTLREGYVLKRPNREQLNIIRRELNPYFALFDSSFRSTVVNRYEVKVVGDNKSWCLEPLEESHFRYTILEYTDINNHNNLLDCALGLSDINLYPLIHIGLRKGGLGVSSNQSHMVSFFQETQFSDNWVTRKIQKSDLEQIDKVFTILTEFEAISHSFPNVQKALSDLYVLNSISRKTPLKIIGIFACLEWLLVDSSNDKLASINQQLQRKIMLLNNRFEKPIDLTQHIKGPDTLTLGAVVKALYDYRSSIAHGSFVAF